MEVRNNFGSSLNDGPKPDANPFLLFSAPLPHTYIHFAHIFKKQHGWAPELSRFSKANGLLYDLEFLVDDSGIVRWKYSGAMTQRVVDEKLIPALEKIEKAQGNAGSTLHTAP